METPPHNPISPSRLQASGDAEGSQGGDGGAEEGEAEGGYSAGLEPLWSALLGTPEELEPMWSPPRGFGVGAEFAAAEVESEPEVDNGGGPWDGAPWRSTGVVAGEGAATTLAPPTAAVGFAEFEPEPAASDSTTAVESSEAVPEVRALEPVPDSSPAPLPSSPPLALEVRPIESVPDSAPVLESPLPPPVASSEVNLEGRVLECTLNSMPLLPLPSPNAAAWEAEDAPKDWSAPEKIASGTMMVIDLNAKDDPEVNAAGCGTPGVISRNGTSLRRSPRIATIMVAANATPLERKGDSFRASKRYSVDSERGRSSEGSDPPVSTRPIALNTVDMLNRMELQGSREIVAMQSQSSSSENENKGGALHNQVVVALPVVNNRSLKYKLDSVRPPRRTKSASKFLVNSDRVPTFSPVANSGPPVQKVDSHAPHRKHKLAFEKCLPNLERVDASGAVLCNLELVNAKSRGQQDAPLGPEGRSSQPPKAKRARISSGERLANLKRTENNSGSICKTPGVTMMSDPCNKPKLFLDKYLTDSEMVESDDGSCFFVGEAVPEGGG